MSGGPPLVVLEKCSVRYRDRWALRDIDLVLGAGEHLCITGSNGSGKTTLLRLIAGELWPAPDRTGRRTYAFGAGPEDDAVGARRRIRLVGAASQDRCYQLGLNLRGADMVATGFEDSPILRRRLTAADEQQVRKCLLRVDARYLADRRFAELSRGEQRHLLIARALVSAPRILCLDEICDGLDDTACVALLATLERIAGDDLTLVLATHHEDEVPKVVTRWLHLAGGCVAPSSVGATSVATEVAPATFIPAHRVQQPRIVIENADVYRAARRVLRGLDWQLAPGQHWLIRGANGAGKSTFIKLLHGDLRPAAGGRIEWFGLGPLPNIWQLRRRIGLVSDELQTIYLDRLTVAQCVATGFSSSIGRVPVLAAAEAAAIEHWLDALGLAALRDASIRELSYGQFRRVLLARALVTGPEVLLLDEPVSGLDRESRALFRGTLVQVAGQGGQIVVAAHRENPAGDLITNQAEIRAGHLVAEP